MSAIELSEITTDETGTYIQIWKDDENHSFLIEDVLEAMTDTSTARAIELTGGEAKTLAEALDQWELEREAIGELYDENQAHAIYARRVDMLISLAMQVVSALEMDAALFMSQKTRDKVAQVREQHKQMEAVIVEMTAIREQRRYHVKVSRNP